MGENKKVTTMVLKVDLQCEKCYRKVKRVLCKFPQIRDQTYDEKNNQVIIKVVSCNPEKFRDKLCCKGGGVITSIDIIEPPPVNPPPVKPPPVNPPPVNPPPVNPPPPPVKPPPTPCTCRPTPCTCRPNPCTCRPNPCTCPPNPCTCRPTPCTCRPTPCTCPPTPCTCRPTPCTCPPNPCTCRPTPCTCRPNPCKCRPTLCTCPPTLCTCRPTSCTCPRPPVTCPPLPPPVIWPRPPVNTCCTDCCGGHPGGSCPIVCGCGVLVCDSYSGWRSYNTRSFCVTRTDCFIEENPQACAIM